MSADAKVWADENGWHGIHDGKCHNETQHNGTEFDLIDVLLSIEACMGAQGMRWVHGNYPNGLALRGYIC